MKIKPIVCISLSCIFWFLMFCGAVSAADDLAASFSIRIPTPQEEFGIVWNTLKQMPFYKNYGYRVGLPEREEFQRLARKPGLMKKADRHQLYSFFADDVYRSSHYENGLNNLKSRLQSIQNAVEKLRELKSLWGFEIYNHYDVILTLYGPGGLFYPDTGQVFIKTSKAGEFARKNPAHTVVHEMVHLGIHRSIIKRYHLNHHEKEKVVDYICTNFLADVLTDYKSQSFHTSQFDAYLDEKAILNLPAAVAAYKKDFLDVLVIENIHRKSQAHGLGLQEGDIIYKYHDQRTTDAGSFARIVRANSSKRRIEMIVIREGKTKRFVLKGGRIGIKIAGSRMPKDSLPEDLKDLK